MPELSRDLEAGETLFVDGETMPWKSIHAIEGQLETGNIAFRQLLVSARLLAVEVFREKGTIDPVHAHPDHDSICYLVKGRARVVIDGHEFIGRPGCAWLHPAGVEHYCEALEDCVQIEFKAPPRKTWDLSEDS
ncbi:MAG: cupin domain-containing protein [Rhodobacteraceae bacterium]|nr:cupin domain-containing protein [Paracoccaceae bacterium]